MTRKEKKEQKEPPSADDASIYEMHPINSENENDDVNRMTKNRIVTKQNKKS